MEFRNLVKDGPEIPVIGLGTWQLGGGMGHVSHQTGIKTVHKAVDSGITLIDTAQLYRGSEELIGKALLGGRRDKVFLATKASWKFSKKDITASMENSLRMLQVDHVDLYQIHWCDESYSITESMEAMGKLQEQGKTRFIGLSNFTIEQMNKARETIPFQSLQPRYNMLDRGIEEEILPFCEEHGIGVLSYSPLAKGLLTGSYKAGHRFQDDDERSDNPQFKGSLFDQNLAKAQALAKVASEKSISLVQLAIAWQLRLNSIKCVLIGAKSPQQVQEHLGSIGISFNNDELRRIDEILAL